LLISEEGPPTITKLSSEKRIAVKQSSATETTQFPWSNEPCGKLGSGRFDETGISIGATLHRGIVKC